MSLRITLLVIAVLLMTAIVAIPAGAQIYSPYGMSYGFGSPYACSPFGTSVGFATQNTFVAESCFTTAGGFGFGFPYGYGCGYPLSYGYGLGACGVYDYGIASYGMPFSTGLGCGFATPFY